MVFYEGKCLDLLSKNEIKRYLLHLIKVEKVSRSTQINLQIDDIPELNMTYSTV